MMNMSVCGVKVINECAGTICETDHVRLSSCEPPYGFHGISLPVACLCGQVMRKIRL